MSDDRQEKVQELTREEFFRRKQHDLSGLPQGLRITGGVVTKTKTEVKAHKPKKD